MLSLKHLSFTWNEKFRLGPVDANFVGGDCVAVIGKNGSGKSTLFSLIAGILDTQTGSIEILGQNMSPEAYQLKKHVGYLPQNLDLPKWVSAADLLNYAASVYGSNPAPDNLIDYWDLREFAHKPTASCSYGMQKRVGLALASFHEPDILILDEPFSGLDIFHIRALENLINARMLAKKLTILSTHTLSFALQRCNRCLLVKDGAFTEPSTWTVQTPVQREQHVENFFFGTS